MQRILIFLLIHFSLDNILSATHLKGGEITYESTGTLNQYKFTFTLYTDSNSVVNFGVDEPTATLDFGDGSTSTVNRDQRISIGDATFKNLYTFIHTYSSIATYIVSYSRDNRNSNILNINGGNSGNVPFYVESSLIVNPTFHNNSVKFLGKPIPQIQKNKVFNGNVLAYDPDGDSIAFTLTSAMEAKNTSVSNYAYPNFLGGVFSINSLTGEIIWDKPTKEGLYDVAIKISEFRNGINIGYTILDYTIIVFPTNTGTNQYFTLKTDLNFDSNNIIHLNEDDKVSLKMIFSDSAASKVIELSCFSELLENNNASWVVQDSGSLGKKGAFQFTALSTLKRNQPYNVTFRGCSYTDGIYCTDRTYTFYIGPWTPVTAINKPVSDLIHLFPNPSSDFVQIEMTENEGLNIHIIDIKGRLVGTETINGSNPQIDVSSLDKGEFQLIFLKENSIIDSRKIVKE